MKQPKNHQKLRVTSIEITCKPIANDYSPEEIKCMKKIHKLISENPKEAVNECKTAIKAYPKVPIFYNNLFCAYQAINDIKNMKKYIHEAYERFPDYLFAKCAYANLKLESGNLDEIPKIFGNSFCLNDVYPSRNVFHVDEILAFHLTMGMYFIRICSFKTAEVFLYVLEKIAPKEKATKCLEKELTAGRLAHFASIMDKKTRKKGNACKKLMDRKKT